MTKKFFAIIMLMLTVGIAQSFADKKTFYAKLIAQPSPSNAGLVYVGTASTSNPDYAATSTCTNTAESVGSDKKIAFYAYCKATIGYHYSEWTGNVSVSKLLSKVEINSTSNDEANPTTETITAVFLPNTYKVYYDANGGKGSMDKSDDQTYGTPYTLSTNEFTREGYNFAGWNTKADGTGTSYKNGASVNIATETNGEKVTLYAQWTPIEYSITYFLFNGSLDEGKTNPSTYTIETPTFTLNTPSKTGYIFSGWTTSLSDEEETPQPSVTITKGTTGNKVYYANYTANTYTIVYDANGGTGTMGNTACTYDTSTSLSKNTFERAGYTFTGWKDDEYNTYTDGQSVKNLTTENGATITLHAQWKITEYTIKYTLNGGTLADGVTNPETYTIDTEDFTLNNPSQIGYTFEGWSGTDLTERSTSVTIAKGSTGDREYTANFTASTYTVTLVAGDGATCEPASFTVTYGGTYDKLPTPTRDGYGFQGWFTEENGGGTKVTTATKVEILEDQTLYAFWELKGQTMTLSYLPNKATDWTSKSWQNKDFTETITVTAKEDHDLEKTDPLYRVGFCDCKLSVADGYILTGYKMDFEVASTPLAKATFTASYSQSQVANEDATITSATVIKESLLSDEVTKNPGSVTIKNINSQSHEFKFRFEGALSDGYRGINITAVDATYETVKYTIAYEGCEGATNNNPETYTVESEDITLAEPTKDGYTFTGWTYDGQTEPTKDVTIAKGSTGNKTFTANWKENETPTPEPTIGDVTKISEEILSNSYSEGIDVNKDGKISIVDITLKIKELKK